MGSSTRSSQPAIRTVRPFSLLPTVFHLHTPLSTNTSTSPSRLPREASAACRGPATARPVAPSTSSRAGLAPPWRRPPHVLSPYCPHRGRASPSRRRSWARRRHAAPRRRAAPPPIAAVAPPHRRLPASRRSQGRCAHRAGGGDSKQHHGNTVGAKRPKRPKLFPGAKRVAVRGRESASSRGQPLALPLAGRRVRPCRPSSSRRRSAAIGSWIPPSVYSPTASSSASSVAAPPAARSVARPVPKRSRSRTHSISAPSTLRGCMGCSWGLKV